MRAPAGRKNAVRAGCLDEMASWCKAEGSPAGRGDRVPHMKSYTRYS
jgi:hypothetical protein